MSCDRLAGLIQAFQDCYGDLLKFLTAKLGCPSLAKDFTQDIYIRVAGLQPQQEIVSPRKYLFTIAWNLVFNEQQRLLRQQTVSPEEAGLEELPSAARPADDVLFAKQQVAIVDAALDNLSSKCRDALLLSRLEGLSHAEIAHRLGVSPSMVAKYIAQAVAHCQSHLKDESPLRRDSLKEHPRGHKQTVDRV